MSVVGGLSSSSREKEKKSKKGKDNKDSDKKGLNMKNSDLVVASDKIDPHQIRKAVAALLQWIGKKNKKEKNGSDNILNDDDDELLYLNVTLKKIGTDRKSVKPRKMYDQDHDCVRCYYSNDHFD